MFDGTQVAGELRFISFVNVSLAASGSEWPRRKRGCVGERVIGRESEQARNGDRGEAGTPTSDREGTRGREKQRLFMAEQEG